MRGARQRLRLEIEMRNRQAWNTASLTGLAFAGKLPAFERCFGGGPQAGPPQSPPVLAAMGRALAAAWGAKMPDPPEGS